MRQAIVHATLFVLFIYMGIWVPFELLASGKADNIVVGIVWGFFFWAIVGYALYLQGLSSK